VDLEESLTRAKEDMDLLAEENIRRTRIKAKATYQTEEVSPFMRRFNDQQLERQPDFFDRCSPKQAGLICYLSRQCGENWTYDRARNLSRKQASGVISKLKGEVL
jgi:hypothetical protein